MKEFSSTPPNLSGQLLVAHPSLRDPNFSRRVVLIASHSAEEGALGVIVNWSMEKRLGEVDSGFLHQPLGKSPIYVGGPVASEQLTLVAWNWESDQKIFRLGFGIEPEQASQLLEKENYEVRAFLGYAGWGQGQLEQEMAENSWIVSPVDGQLITQMDGADLWREIVGSISLEMRLSADAPEDPSVN